MLLYILVFVQSMLSYILIPLLIESVLVLYYVKGGKRSIFAYGSFILWGFTFIRLYFLDYILCFVCIFVLPVWFLLLRKENRGWMFFINLILTLTGIIASFVLTIALLLVSEHHRITYFEHGQDSYTIVTNQVISSGLLRSSSDIHIKVYINNPFVAKEEYHEHVDEYQSDVNNIPSLETYDEYHVYKKNYKIESKS